MRVRPCLRGARYPALPLPGVSDSRDEKIDRANEFDRAVGKRSDPCAEQLARYRGHERRIQHELAIADAEYRVQARCGGTERGCGNKRRIVNPTR